VIAIGELLQEQKVSVIDAMGFQSNPSFFLLLYSFRDFLSIFISDALRMTTCTPVTADSVRDSSGFGRTANTDYLRMASARLKKRT
jgi:hypothetical protein